MPHRRAPFVFRNIVLGSLPDMILGREDFAITVAGISHTHDYIRNRNACKTTFILSRIIEKVHQCNHTTMTPSHDTHTTTIHNIEIIHHIVTADVHVFVFQSTIIYIIVCSRSVSGASPVVRCHHDVFLRYQLTDDMGIIGVHIGMYPTVRKYDQRIFLVFLHTFGNKNVCSEFKFVTSTHRSGIGLLPTRWST